MQLNYKTITLKAKGYLNILLNFTKKIQDKPQNFIIFTILLLSNFRTAKCV
jgi:hypothetical protein